MSNQITLAEAVPLLKVIENRIRDLVQERERNSFVLIEKGDNYTRPDRDVELITKEIEEAQRDYRKLAKAIAEQNLNNYIEWDGDKISIAEAIELAKQLRSESQNLKRLAAYKKHEYENRGFGDTSNLIRVALYEPDEVRQQALKLERKANRLSALIEAKNHTITFTVEGIEKYTDF